jgi:hypothetical protein
MNKTLTILVASTALTAAIGVPAWSSIHRPEGRHDRAVTVLPAEGPQAMSLILASSDDDDDDDHHRRDRPRRGHDDDDHDDDDDDDDDDEGGKSGGARNPAPAGTVAPPQNGLFGNGMPPKVQVN